MTNELGTHPMRLRPREQWICDTCGEVIEKPADGWLEFLQTSFEDGFRRYGFRIVHHASVSPKNPNRPKRSNGQNCYSYGDSGDSGSYHLERIVGRDGLALVLSMLDKGEVAGGANRKIGVVDVNEWAELIRRLALPHYEEARLYFDKARAAGFFEGANEVAVYSQQMLTDLLEEYGQPEHR